MESNVINLQEKIKKLMDQYTADRKRLEQLEEENNNLREENRQLMEQIENTKKFHSGSELKIKELENQVKLLQAQYKELQDSLAGLEEIASTTINQIDQLIPDLDNKK